MEELQYFDDVFNISFKKFSEKLMRKKGFKHVEKELNRLKEQLVKFEHIFISNKLHLGLFYLDCERVKELLWKKLKKRVDGFSEILINTCSKYNKAVNNRCEELIEILEDTP